MLITSVGRRDAFSSDVGPFANETHQEDSVTRIERFTARKSVVQKTVSDVKKKKKEIHQQKKNTRLIFVKL